MLWLNVINYAPETQDSLGAGGSSGEDTGLRRCGDIERLHCPPQSDVKLHRRGQAVSTFAEKTGFNETYGFVLTPLNSVQPQMSRVDEKKGRERSATIVSLH